MNPIHLSETLQSQLVKYLTTTFDVNRDGLEPELAAAIADSFEMNGALFKGPFLELTPPYRKGRSLQTLVQERVLSDKLLKLPCFARGKPLPPNALLYEHQELAIRKLATDQRNAVISSGTGSGKTECFLIPILNDLLVDPTPGVRALLIYPMNALVNDQLDRLRGLLAGTSITFGRYTSELAQTEQQARERIKDPLPNEVICRDEIQHGIKIPQILITNYAMLEYLLLRPDDSILFQSGSVALYRAGRSPYLFGGAGDRSRDATSPIEASAGTPIWGNTLYCHQRNPDRQGCVRGGRLRPAFVCGTL